MFVLFLSTLLHILCSWLMNHQIHDTHMYMSSGNRMSKLQLYSFSLSKVFLFVKTTS